MDSVCVFCGSREGNDPAYIAAAQATGRAIARRGWTLVYGGGHVGLMGALADAALAEDGEVIGVMPRALLTREIAHPEITRIHLVTSMHRRKALMSSLADGFLTLPGGYGTLEEFLLALVDTQIHEGFARDEHRQLILNGEDPDELLDRMAAYIPPGSIDPVPDLPFDGPPVHRDLEPAAMLEGNHSAKRARS